MTTHTEQWKPIPGSIGYDVSNRGRVRSYHKKGCSGNLSSSPRLILKAFPNDGGYLLVNLSQNGLARKYRVHRLVALAFLGPCPENQEVCHKDDDPANNHLENLRYDTRMGNIRGEGEPNTKECKRVIINLYPEDWKVIEQKACRDGTSISVALCHIVREWAKQHTSRSLKTSKVAGYNKLAISIAKLQQALTDIQ